MFPIRLRDSGLGELQARHRPRRARALPDIARQGLWGEIIRRWDVALQLIDLMRTRADPSRREWRFNRKGVVMLRSWAYIRRSLGNAIATEGVGA